MRGYEYRVTPKDRKNSSSTCYLVERRPVNHSEARWVEIASCPKKHYAQGIIIAITKADELDELKRMR